MDPYKVQVVLEHIAVENVTPRDDTSTDKEGKDALVKASKIGSRYDMAKYGIPVGAVLRYTSDR
jgi:hypothetical protein